MTAEGPSHAPDDVLRAWDDRVVGLLLAGAVGDAAGAPFEGSARVDRRDVEGILTSDVALRWTDDTALQLALAEHLADVGAEEELEDQALVLAFAHTWERAPWRGYGANPPRIFAAALAGEDWRTLVHGSFGGSGSLGNGGAMRAAPVGVVPGGSSRVAEFARRSAAVTHAHPVGQDGAVVVALTVHHLLHTSPASPPPVREVLRACASQVSTEQFQDALVAVEHAVRLPDPRRASEVTGNGIAADEAVAAALCAALPRLEDPVAAVAFAVQMGGDTDTIAAMAGSMAGAFAGAARLPHELLDRLEERRHIAEVGRRLAERVRPRSG
jgi:poly(ADP-ribose) glycohydrolase ARH3